MMNMPDATVSYGPGHSLQETIRPVPTQDINEQLRQFLAWYGSNVNQGGHHPPHRGFGSAPPGASRPPVTASRGEEGDTSGRLRALQLRMAQGQEADANSVRQMRKIPIDMGPNMGVAYDWDARKANPIQQQAINPGSSLVANSGIASSGSAGLPIAADLGLFAGTTSPVEAKTLASDQAAGNVFEQERLLQALRRSMF